MRMIDESKISNRPEHELSMDEILSSIRNIITEDQETKPELRRTFPEDSTTNPSGARMMEGLPKFDDDEFVLPNFKEEELKERRSEERHRDNTSVFPDEEFKIRQRNERSLQESAQPFYKRDEFAREAVTSEDRISKALRGIVDSYVHQNTQDSKNEESVFSFAHKQSSGRLNETINAMVEKTLLTRVDEWLHKNLPGILEKAILRELERVAGQMKL